MSELSLEEQERQALSYLKKVRSERVQGTAPHDLADSTPMRHDSLFTSVDSAELAPEVQAARTLSPRALRQ